MNPGDGRRAARGAARRRPGGRLCRRVRSGPTDRDRPTGARRTAAGEHRHRCDARRCCRRPQSDRATHWEDDHPRSSLRTRRRQRPPIRRKGGLSSGLARARETLDAPTPNFAAAFGTSPSLGAPASSPTGHVGNPRSARVCAARTLASARVPVKNVSRMREQGGVDARTACSAGRMASRCALCWGRIRRGFWVRQPTAGSTANLRDLRAVLPSGSSARVNCASHPAFAACAGIDLSTELAR